VIFIKKIYTDTFVFCFGYAAYSLIELAWRRYTHFTMGIAGGVCFLALYKLFKRHKNMAIYKKCILGSLVISTVEFVFGIILNKLLRLDIWNYSDIPFNLLGQVCLLYSFLWALLCIPICPLTNKISKIEEKIQEGAA